MATVTNVYNMLQDLRHMIIMDFRKEEEFQKKHIRKSINVNIENYQQKIAELMLDAPQFKSHYEGDDMKRVLMIFPAEKWKVMET